MSNERTGGRQVTPALYAQLGIVVRAPGRLSGECPLLRRELARATWQIINDVVGECGDPNCAACGTGGWFSSPEALADLADAFSGPPRHG